MGEKAYMGRGCGGYPERGSEAARENINEIKKELAGSNLVFIIAGLGGGSGSGSAPIVAEAVREKRIEKAVEQALSAPLIEVSDISSAYGMLIHIMGGEDMTLGEVTQAAELMLKIAPNTPDASSGAQKWMRRWQGM